MTDQTRLDRIEEILKPHYAEIRDPDVRLPAICRCKSDAEKAAFAEGLRGQAYPWATEALLDVLKHPNLPPIKPARFDEIIWRLTVRLAEDAADFFSLDEYDKKVGFPKYGSDIRDLLMEDLPKIAKYPIEVNRRRYLGKRSTGRAAVDSRDQKLELMQDIPADGSKSREQSVAIEEAAATKEIAVNPLPGQGYPKYMRHATMAPVIVNSAVEQAALGVEWSEVNASHYPAWLRHWTKKETKVQNAAADMALGGGWASSSAAFEPYRGPRPPRKDLQDPIKWVDDWSIPELSSKDQNRIKAQLLRADSAFSKSPDADSADLAAMKLAFDGISKVLFEAGILTEQLLQNGIPILVWDSAIAGGWYRVASETPQRIFPERLGHYFVWRDENKDWQGLFRAETAHWRAMLIEQSAEGPSNTPRRAGNTHDSAHPEPIPTNRASARAYAQHPDEQLAAAAAGPSQDTDLALNENREDPAAKNSHVELLEEILKNTTLSKWAAKHKLGRTSVFDWKAARLAGKVPKGKVSLEKCTEIERAIDEDAKTLGLSTRTHSD